MSLAWVILFPLGAAIVRLFNNRFSSGRQAMVVHRALQIGNFVLVVVALILGIAASGEMQSVSSSAFPSRRTQRPHIIIRPPIYPSPRIGAIYFPLFHRKSCRFPRSLISLLPLSRSCIRADVDLVAFYAFPPILWRRPGCPAHRADRTRYFASPAVCEDWEAEPLELWTYLVWTDHHYSGYHQRRFRT
jgi:hypothetical protein